jgi:hypothetical protein
VVDVSLFLVSALPDERRHEARLSTGTIGR